MDYLKKLVFILLTVLIMTTMPVVLADDVTTPERDVVIDEIQYENDSSSKTFSLAFTEYSSGNSSTLRFTSSVYYTCYWTEDVAMSGGFTDVVFFISNVTVGGVSKNTVQLLNSSAKVNNYSYMDYQILNGALRFRTRITCDEYGIVTHTAYVTATH